MVGRGWQSRSHERNSLHRSGNLGEQIANTNCLFGQTKQTVPCLATVPAGQKNRKSRRRNQKSYTPVRTSQHHAKTSTTPSVARSRQDDRFLILVRQSRSAGHVAGSVRTPARAHSVHHLHFQSASFWQAFDDSRNVARNGSVQRFQSQCTTNSTRSEFHSIPRAASRFSRKVARAFCESTRIPGGMGGM